MAKESKFTATIDRVKFLRTSGNGNPSYKVFLKDGQVMHTEPDASVNYGLENPENIGHPVEITTNAAERIIYVRPLEGQNA